MRFTALLPALLLAACATSSVPEPDPWPSGTPPLAETVGWLDERPVTYGEVARYMRIRDPEAFFRNLEGYVLERVTRAEAIPLGVTVEPALLGSRTNVQLLEWEQRVRQESKSRTGEEIDPALWLQRVAGMSMAEFRRHVRRYTEVELLQDRLLRFEQLSSPRIEVSILVVKEKELADRLAREIRGGADFGKLARAHSLHASRSEGGRIAFPFLRGDVNQPSVREKLFAAGEGDLVGPLPTERGHRQIYRIEAVREAATGKYEGLRDQINRTLEARPVVEAEYERWRRRILLRHGFNAAPMPRSEAD
ncbi:MAG: peptidylprolyl isomerase [Planctomycetota bacterium]